MREAHQQASGAVVIGPSSLERQARNCAASATPAMRYLAKLPSSGRHLRFSSPTSERGNSLSNFWQHFVLGNFIQIAQHNRGCCCVLLSWLRHLTDARSQNRIGSEGISLRGRCS